MKGIKRILAFVLSFVMIFTSMPAMGGFAEDSVDMSELIEDQEISEEEKPDMTELMKKRYRNLKEHE